MMGASIGDIGNSGLFSTLYLCFEVEEDGGRGWRARMSDVLLFYII